MKKNEKNIVAWLQDKLVHRDPYIITPYSLFLAEYLKDHASFLAGKVVLDFGSGCGIQSILASLCGAEKVYAVDLQTDALNLTLENECEAQITNITTICNNQLGWDMGIHQKIDFIFSNPASLPSKEKLPPTFWAGVNGDQMIHDLIETADRVLSDTGTLLFINTSLVCLAATLDYLIKFGFNAGIVKVEKLAFRDFYGPMVQHWQTLKAKGLSYFIEENGKQYEFLYLIKAEKNYL